MALPRWGGSSARLSCRALLGIFLLATPVSSIWPFSPKRFSKSSLIQAGPLGLDDGGRIIAFGDFNGDQFLDVLSLDSSQQALSVYLWNHDEFVFWKVSSIQHPSPISNVVPGDFTHDGKLDILVMSEDTWRDTLSMALYQGNHDGTFASQPISVPPSTLSQPIPVDINGDMKIDLLGIPTDRRGSSNPMRVWKNSWNASNSEAPLFELTDPLFNGSQCTLVSPHSNAAIDLNGDCLADIFLVCDEGSGQRSFQIWVNNKDAGFTLAQHETLPSGVQAISFADIGKCIEAVGQLPQTSYHALQVPYAFLGLGRTNNYIENLFVGSTKHTQDHYTNMEGVIPNSRLVIHPPPGKDSGSWKRELYLRPGEWIPWVTLTVIITTAILAIIVFVLHLNEKERQPSYSCTITFEYNPTSTTSVKDQGDSSSLSATRVHARSMYSFPDAQDADSRFGMHIQDQAFLVVGTVSSDMQVNYGSANPRVPAPDIIKTEDSLFSFDSSNERSRTYFGASVTAHEAQSWSHNFSKPPTHDVIKEIILQSRRDKDTIPSDDADLGNDAAEYVPPLTGHAHADNASRMCYSMKPIRSSMHDIAWPLTYMYPVHVILDVLRDMHETCRLILPKRIPAPGGLHRFQPHHTRPR
ncbi:hypothetical protein M404DRAFT_26585 [Pisolithus tinctorius Marx 270]|uniref:T-cell immunomodulatory protein TIP C2 domain-containing protein n=1 Tax=Pisolithus tinctorius Marx 270 TaxID=870435 RepID=A0A0C3K375_PISTI|nr:hypothetical protein M404DRAFT_26585 [Pisolithus tinctorius Marx 270]